MSFLTCALWENHLIHFRSPSIVVQMMIVHGMLRVVTYQKKIKINFHTVFGLCKTKCVLLLCSKRDIVFLNTIVNWKFHFVITVHHDVFLTHLFIHHFSYCHATAKCQLLSQPCNYTCPNTWKYCPDLNLCIQEGSCSDGNSSDSKKHNNPFDIPTDILPVLKITPLYPILEDEELVFQVADVFSIEGVSDFSMNLKNKRK